MAPGVTARHHDENVLGPFAPVHHTFNAVTVLTATELANRAELIDRAGRVLVELLLHIRA